MIRKIAVLWMICSVMSIALADSLDELRLELAAQKKQLVEKALELNDTEQEYFWPVYEDYERDMDVITQDSFALIKKYTDSLEDGTITTQSAENMVAEFFRIEGRKLQAKQGYLPLFKGVLPSKKVFRFYQIDNKVDSLIRAQIARKVPLIEPDVEL